MDEDFDIDRDSKTLKDLVSAHDPVVFFSEISELLKFDGYGRIPFRPFVSLDSPLRQLSYLANLNLTSDPKNAIKTNGPTPEEWEKIIEYSVRVKAGYYDALLPQPEDREDEFNDMYQTAMPVFFDYYDTGTINYEEQEIERIVSLFTPFDLVIEAKLNLKVSEFIATYDLIDAAIERNLNEPIKLVRENSEVREFKDEMIRNQAGPSTWKYSGDNVEVRRFIEIFTSRLAKNILRLSGSKELDAFLKLFSTERTKSDFQYYTEPNGLLLRPIYRMSSDEFLILSHKQLLHAIYRLLYTTVTSSPKAESFFEHRGWHLQNKIVSLFRRYLKGEGYYYNEYKVDGHGQDILITHRSLAFIIEAKAGKEVSVSGVPNIKHLYAQYLNTFKKNIDKAYEQSYRVKEKFIEKRPLQICDEDNVLIREIKTSKFRRAFSIIVTQDRFRKPQINLPDLLEIYDDDDFPLSICVDDLEVVILTMIKKGITPGHFERLLIKREGLQGRLESNDELEIWGVLLSNPDFKVLDNAMHFRPPQSATNLFDELYAKGLGFDNERKAEKKKSNQWKIFMGYNDPSIKNNS